MYRHYPQEGYLIPADRREKMAGEVTGASVPDGIDVDDAAAYFGATESSDIVHSMMAMERAGAFQKFFSLLGDVVLKPGEFDFELASQSLNCEGGEIYYLVAGHLGIMSMADNLCDYLGLPNSQGDTKAGNSNLSKDEIDSLSSLCDPMKLLKLFAIANSTGDSNEVSKYLEQLEILFSNPESNLESLSAVATELKANLESSGNLTPVSALASGTAKPSVVSVPKLEEKPKPEKSPKPVQQPKKQEPEIKTESVPLPGKEKVVESKPEKEIDIEKTESVPLPTGVTPAPEVKRVEPAPDERELEKATLNAFASAFTGQPAPANTVVEEKETPVVSETEEIIQEQVAEQVIDEEPSVEDFPDDFVSIAEKFEAADADGDGTLDVEEIATAMEISVEQAKDIHESADLDGDGSVSLGEVIASQATENKINLPKPVRAAPVRPPIGSNSPSNQSQNQAVHGGMSLPNQGQNPNQQQFNQNQMNQQNMNQAFQNQNQQFNQQFKNQQFNQGFAPNQNFNQNMNQGFQPTIMSGMYCRGCGIGVDPQWRFCPICGSRNQ